LISFFITGEGGFELVYLNYHQSQIFRYFGLPFYDVGHPKFIVQDYNKGKYYWSLQPKIKYDKKLENNLPIRYYDGKKDISPINLAQVGIALLDGDYSEDSFKSIIRWIIQNTEEKNGVNYWSLNYDVPTFKIRAPWKSGLAQGLMLSFLVRYYRKFSDKKLEKLIDGTLNSVVLPINKGGCSRKWKSHYIIEEYIGPSVVGVLNGHISALLSLKDYLDYFKKDKEIKDFFNENLSNLYKNIMNWKCDSWSYYNLSNPKLISSIFYQELHIVQMKTLLKISYDDNGKNFLDTLIKEYKSPIKRIKALKNKRKEISDGVQKI